MSAHEPPEDREGEGSGGGDDEARAAGPAGAGGFLRRHGRTLVAVVIVAIAGYAALAGPGGSGGSDGDPDDAGAGSTTTSPVEGSTTATTAPGATEVTDPAPSSTLVPPDIEEDRPAIDLTTPPPADDPVEVARWWAGTYTAYAGAEPPVDLVARLADWTAPGLLDDMRAVPPAASYDAPLAVDGVSEVDLPASAGAGRLLRVSVQTPVALVIYDMTLVQGSGGGWLVSEAARM